jgi:hypothetical protein
MSWQVAPGGIGSCPRVDCWGLLGVCALHAVAALVQRSTACCRCSPGALHWIGGGRRFRSIIVWQFGVIQPVARSCPAQDRLAKPARPAGQAAERSCAECGSAIRERARRAAACVPHVRCPCTHARTLPNEHRPHRPARAKQRIGGAPQFDRPTVRLIDCTP